MRDDLQRLDEAGLGATPDAYRAVTRRLEALPGKVDRARLFQAELIKTPRVGESDTLVLGTDLLEAVSGRCDLVLHGHRHCPTHRSVEMPGAAPVSIFNAGSSTELGRSRIFLHQAGALVGRPWWMPSPPARQVDRSAMQPVSVPARGA